MITLFFVSLYTIWLYSYRGKILVAIINYMVKFHWIKIVKTLKYQIHCRCPNN